jgi:hypothetical protein
MRSRILQVSRIIHVAAAAARTSGRVHHSTHRHHRADRTTMPARLNGELRAAAFLTAGTFGAGATAISGQEDEQDGDAGHGQHLGAAQDHPYRGHRTGLRLGEVCTRFGRQGHDGQG